MDSGKAYDSTYFVGRPFDIPITGLLDTGKHSNEVVTVSASSVWDYPRQPNNTIRNYGHDDGLYDHTINTIRSYSGTGYWWTPNGQDGWVNFMFNEPIIATNLFMKPVLIESTSAEPNLVWISGSNDGINFVDISSRYERYPNSYTNQPVLIYYNFNHDRVAYKHIRINMFHGSKFNSGYQYIQSLYLY